DSAASSRNSSTSASPLCASMKLVIEATSTADFLELRRCRDGARAAALACLGDFAGEKTNATAPGDERADGAALRLGRGVCLGRRRCHGRQPVAGCVSEALTVEVCARPI